MIAWSALQGASLSAPSWWERAWIDIARLQTLTRSSPAFRTDSAELAERNDDELRKATARGDKLAMFRGQLLEWHLQSLAGRNPLALEAPRIAVPFERGEAWMAMQALSASPLRADAVVAALDEDVCRTDRSERTRRIEFARRIAQQDVRDPESRHLENAERTLTAIDHLAPDVVSARELAEVERRRGRLDAARELLSTRIARADDEHSEGELLFVLARVDVAGGDTLTAIHRLGEALARGSTEAGGLLARLALHESDHDTARRVARRDLGASQDGGAIALRLWGLAQIGAAEAPTRGGAELR